MYVVNCCSSLVTAVIVSFTFKNTIHYLLSTIQLTDIATNQLVSIVKHLAIAETDISQKQSKKE